MLPYKVRTATILAGEKASSPIDIDHYRVAAFVMPSEWTAANLTVQGSPERDGTYLDVYDDKGQQFTMTADTDRIIISDAAVPATAGLKFIRLQSTEVQVAERTIKIILKG